MHARVTSVTFQPGSTETAIRLFEEDVLPAYQQQPGFKGLLVLTDSHTGRGVSIALWDSEEALEANENSGSYFETIRTFAPLFAGAPLREVYEVSLNSHWSSAPPDA